MSSTDNAKEDGLKSTKKDDGASLGPYRVPFIKRLVDRFVPLVTPEDR